MDENMSRDIEKLKALEDKYGLELFWMSAIHLFEVGIKNMTNKAAVDEAIKSIMQQGEADKTGGKITVMTPYFERKIMECAAEIATYTPLTFFAYVKKHLVISSWSS